MILDNIGDHPERSGIIDIFQKTCQALLPLQRNDGAFETVLLPPGKTYRELSFTALVASGFLQGFRMGILGPEFKEAGCKAFQCVVDALEVDENGIKMPEISAPTIPMPIFPYLGYKCVPRGKNWSYGLAAFLFAAIEMDRSKKA
jgi:unsaturated rhamnogalacturonyl hydrolase